MKRLAIWPAVNSSPTIFRNEPGLILSQLQATFHSQIEKTDGYGRNIRPIFTASLAFPCQSGRYKASLNESIVDTRDQDASDGD